MLKDFYDFTNKLASSKGEKQDVFNYGKYHAIESFGKFRDVMEVYNIIKSRDDVMNALTAEKIAEMINRKNPRSRENGRSVAHQLRTLVALGEVAREKRYFGQIKILDYHDNNGCPHYKLVDDEKYIYWYIGYLNEN